MEFIWKLLHKKAQRDFPDIVEISAEDLNQKSDEAAAELRRVFCWMCAHSKSGMEDIFQVRFMFPWTSLKKKPKAFYETSHGKWFAIAALEFVH